MKEYMFSDYKKVFKTSLSVYLGNKPINTAIGLDALTLDIGYILYLYFDFDLDIMKGIMLCGLRLVQDCSIFSIHLLGA